MKLVAITGSIGTGKTTLAEQVQKLGYVVYKLDHWTAQLYGKKCFIDIIKKAFPDVADGEKINKKKLRAKVFDDVEELRKLEKLVHPFLEKRLRKVLNRNKFSDDIFFIDAALIFEMGWDKYCDLVIVTTVDYNIQKQRVMKRDNISELDFDKINNIQMKAEDKIEKADIIVDTDKPLNLLRCEMINIIEGLWVNG